MPREFDDRQMDRDSVMPTSDHMIHSRTATGAHGPLGDGPAKKHSVAQSTAPAMLVTPLSEVPRPRCRSRAHAVADVIQYTTLYADAVITLLLNVAAEFKRYLYVMKYAQVLPESRI